MLLWYKNKAINIYTTLSNTFFIMLDDYIEVSVKNKKTKVMKNVITFWLYKLLDCLRPYMLYNKRATSLFLITLSDFIPSGNFLMIDKSLSIYSLSRYIFIISIWFTNNRNKRRLSGIYLGIFCSLLEKRFCWNLFPISMKNFMP